MKRCVWLWGLSGFAVTSFLGTLLHFLYDWLSAPLWIAPFSGVNESTFEHMKLLFWPMVIFALVQGFFFGEYKAFFHIKLCGMLIGLLLIPVIFYTYNGAIAKSPDWLNIAIFFVAAAAVYLFETVQFNKNPSCKSSSVVPLLIIAAIALAFALFTFYPPKIKLFQDPLTLGYGI